MATVSSETLGDRLPDALRRIGRWLGTDAALKANREFIADLMAIHAAAYESQKLRKAIDFAVRGIRAEISDETQWIEEKLAMIDMRVCELNDAL